MEEDDKKLQWISDWGSLPQQSGMIESKGVVPLAEKIAKSAEKKPLSLVQVLRKIPLLVGLSPPQLQKLLAICEPKTLASGDLLLQNGTPITALSILLAGQLAVVTRDGLRVTEIKPVNTVGEMGIIVRHLSSVSVEAVRTSQVLSLDKERLEAVLHEDPEIRGLIYRNLIATLSAKLIHENVRTRDHLLECEAHEARLRAAERRLQLALDIIEQHQVMPAAEAMTWIDERLAETVPRVLVVDDEPEIRQLIAKVLADYNVVQAVDGREALALAQQIPPTLVITDVRMPKMDGLTLLGHLKEEYPDMPVIGISGYVDADAVEKKGFDGFMTKPMPLKQLKTMVQDHLP